jgi:protein arginine kinase activator
VKCDKCGNEATVHEVTIRSGKKVERHLCETCAKGEGLPVQSAHASLAHVITQHIAQQQAAASSQNPGAQTEVAKATQCPTCGTTYAQFRHDGLLGCADCYATFEGQLGPLLERAHEGGTHHVGKIPRRIAAPPLGLPQGRMARAAETPAPAPAPPPEDPAKERARRAETLRRKPAEAVAAEQYESAAKLRDELRQLGEPTGAAQAAAPAAAKKTGGRDKGPGPGGGGVGGGGGGGK